MVAELVEVLRAVSVTIYPSKDTHCGVFFLLKPNFFFKILHPVAKNDTPLWYFCTEMLINTHLQTFEIWFGMSIFV